MQKTKLGVSIGLVGAALYFLAAINIIPAFLLAAYVLLYEENEWLKKSAIKMMIVTVVFGLLFVGVGLIQDVFGVLNYVINWVHTTNITVPLNLDRILQYVITFFQDFILVIMGFKALSMGTVKSEFIDKTIDKHM